MKQDTPLPIPTNVNPQPNPTGGVPPVHQVPEESVAKPKKTFILYPTAILLVIVSGLAGYLGYQNYQLKKSIQVQPQPTNTPATITPSTPTPDPTANWKTYTNNKYHLSFKYPSNWVLAENSYLNPVNRKNAFDITLTDPTNTAKLTIGVINTNNKDESLGRTGVGNGEFIGSGMEVTFFDKTLRPTFQNLANKTHSVYYSQETISNPPGAAVKINELEFDIELDGTTYESSITIDFQTKDKEIFLTTNKILSTFNLTE